MSRRGPKEPAPDLEGSPSSRVDKPDESSIGEESRAFREAMRDVKPHEHSPRIRPTHRGRTPGTPRRAHHGAPSTSVARGRSLDAGPAQYVDASAEQDIGGSEALSFRRSGVRDQTIRKLRRGLVPVEDELDLHGLTQPAARDLLEEFIVFQREAGHRCVRIIHGKGYRSGARGPILKMLVNGWLKRHLDVLAFCSARPIDGGTGAVYVLLRS